ncbi:hypothetical protein IW262DRAFT_1296409 [Armillaria fumosa]|nr:hypothetical protein IW262DRAFT_1296409 [Armillaria fumosa]
MTPQPIQKQAPRALAWTLNNIHQARTSRRSDMDLFKRRGRVIYLAIFATINTDHSASIIYQMMQTSPEEWAPCVGCSCSNHHTSSFDILDEDVLSYEDEFTRLTTSNEPPAPGEAHALQSMLSKAEKRIVLLERHIQQIDEMTERQGSVGNRWHRNASGRETWRLLAEVITEISRHTIEITPPKGWVSSATNESTHWEFQHRESIKLVSMWWRDALLSHRKLWSNIIIQDVSTFKSGTLPR